MIRIALVAAFLSAQDEGLKLKYGESRLVKDKVDCEFKMAISIKGSDQMANFVRTMHPLLSLEKLTIQAEGVRQIGFGKKTKIEYDESRLTARYDGDDLEVDYARGQAPEPGDNKLRQMMWMMCAGGRHYTLLPDGAYESADPNQDQNGEAMDLYSMSVTRLPEGALKEGGSYTVEWTGRRTEKNKKGKYKFKQETRVVSIGKKAACLESRITGQVEVPEGERDSSAEEAWNKCDGTVKVDIEVETGRILKSEGKGKVTHYFRGTAEDGSKNELTLSFEVEGKVAVK